MIPPGDARYHRRRRVGLWPALHSERAGETPALRSLAPGLLRPGNFGRQAAIFVVRNGFKDGDVVAGPLDFAAILARDGPVHAVLAADHVHLLSQRAAHRYG